MINMRIKDPSREEAVQLALRARATLMAHGIEVGGGNAGMFSLCLCAYLEGLGYIDAEVILIGNTLKEHKVVFAESKLYHVATSIGEILIDDSGLVSGDDILLKINASHPGAKTHWFQLHYFSEGPKAEYAVLFRRNWTTHWKKMLHIVEKNDGQLSETS